MKLCITAAGNDLSAPTESAFGRAPWFVLVDTDSGTAEGIENTSVNATQGAGIAAAQTMADHGVGAVLTGRLGPKAKAALEAGGIATYEGLSRTTVGQALEEFRAGKYSGAGATAAGATAAAPRSAGPPADQFGGFSGSRAGGGSGGGLGRCGGAGGGRRGGGQGGGQGRGCGCGGAGQGRRRGR